MSPLHHRSRLDRRSFLAGLAATGLTGGVVAACSGDDDEDGGDDDGAADAAGSDDQADESDEQVADFSDAEGSQPGGGEFLLVQRIPDGILVPGVVRYPLQLIRDAVIVNDGPEELGAQLTDIDLNPIGDRIVAARRETTPDAYYAFRPTIDEPGIYRLVVDGGPVDGVAFQVLAPEQVAIASPGDLLPGFDTPTVGDDGGLETICTRDPQCEFHSVTLAEALSTGKSVAYLVGTPAFCQTGSCTPGLEALVSAMPDFADTHVAVHAEVYTDSTATELAPAMAATGLSFEPSMFITRPDGTISERLDGIWNESELREALERAIA